MSAELSYPSYSRARDHLRDVLDSAQRGLMPRIDRDRSRFVVLDADTHRRDLAEEVTANARVLPEGGGWAVILPDLPVHGDGISFDDALADVIDALREYAEDWNLRLHRAPNHATHRKLVQLVQLSSDEQLREWLLEGDAGVAVAR